MFVGLRRTSNRIVTVNFTLLDTDRYKLILGMDLLLPWHAVHSIAARTLRGTVSGASAHFC